MPIKTRVKKKLVERIKNVKELPTTPLWKGPIEEGITQSMLGSYLVCNERFLIKSVRGIKPQEGFSKSLEYGNMWHTCEEALAAHQDWVKPLQRYAIELGHKYPNDKFEINKWYNVCNLTFPVYVEFWEKHTDEKKRTPLFQEEVFHLPYELPSGRVVNLKGKFDSVDIIGKSVLLMENKTKAEIDEVKLKNELPNTLQPMFYLTALQAMQDSRKLGSKLPIAGVRYNVVRRPLGGGKHTVSQHKGRKTKSGIVGAETKQMFYDRLQQLIRENASYFFMRWKCEISKTDLARFQKEVMNPILENLCDWYEWIEFCCVNDEDRFNAILRQEQFPEHVPRHYRLPYGIYNVMLEGRDDAFNHYITNGTMAGMMKVETLFPELQ